jgi:flagellar hook-basal body complex protein FliE
MPITNLLPVTTGGLTPLFDGGVQKTEDGTAGLTSLFQDIYSEMIDTNTTMQEDAVKLINGEIDDLHTIYNDITKAQIAVETFVAIKNVTVASFQQIMQTQM